MLHSLSDINDKETKLLNVAEQLKTEFFGVDRQIDEILKGVRGWFLLPEALRRPVVVNVWGMTGVGKTTLILRMIELMGMTQSMVFEDMGKQVSDVTNHADNFIQHSMHLNGSQAVFVLDDIHMAKSFGSNDEIDRPLMRDFWALLDHGMVQRDMTTVRDYRQTLRDRMANYKRQKANFPDDTLNFNDHIPEWDMEWLRRLGVMSMDQMMNIEMDVEIWCTTMIKHIDRILEQRHVIDLRKSLVFLTGNLDSIIPLVQDHENVRSLACGLHSACQGISVAQIKQALHQLFRAEQVGRMGNNHVLLPSLHEKSFDSVIDKKLNELSKFAKDNFSFDLNFCNTIRDYLFEKGVVPYQGCRSILSTISSEIESRLAHWIIKMSYSETKEFIVIYSKDEHTFDLKNSLGKVVYTDRLEKPLPVTFDETFDLITSVHEAGHAVVAIVTMGLLPERVELFRDPKYPSGLVKCPEFSIISMKGLKAALPYYLGGRVAESIVFGKEKISFGSQEDIRNATEHAAQFINSHGSGHHIGSSYISQNAPSNLTSFKESDDKAVELLLKDADQSASFAIHQQLPLFHAIVNELRANSKISRARMTEIFKKHYDGDAKEAEQILARTKPSFYDGYQDSWQKFKTVEKVA